MLLLEVTEYSVQTCRDKENLVYIMKTPKGIWLLMGLHSEDQMLLGKCIFINQDLVVNVLLLQDLMIFNSKHTRHLQTAFEITLISSNIIFWKNTEI